MPIDEHELIAKIQSSLTQRGVVATKSMVLRAALHALKNLDPQERVKLLKAMPIIKTGRPAGNNN